MKYLVLVLAFIATAYAASDCSTTPPQWFGYFRQIGWDVDTPTQLVFRIANASYDRDAGKVRITDADVGFNGQYTDTLLDFKGGMNYTAVGGRCIKTKLEGDVPSFGVSGDSKYESSEFIGSELPNLGVLVNEYNNIIKDKSISLSSYAPVTGSVCVPVMSTDLTAKPRLTMNLIYYTNVTTTVPSGGLDKPGPCQ